MSTFKEYPKMLVHPGYRPAVCSTIFPLGYKPKPGETEKSGSPAILPPVTVNDANQEDYYLAKGYVPEGTTSSEATDEAALPLAYAYQQYPKWVRMYDDDVLVHSEAEEHELLGYNPPEKVRHASPDVPRKVTAKNKGGRPKGSKNKKPAHDHMAVNE